MVAHAVNPRYSGNRGKKSSFQASQGNRVRACLKIPKNKVYLFPKAFLVYSFLAVKSTDRQKHAMRRILWNLPHGLINMFNFIKPRVLEERVHQHSLCLLDPDPACLAGCGYAYNPSTQEAKAAGPELNSRPTWATQTVYERGEVWHRQLWSRH